MEQFTCQIIPKNLPEEVKAGRAATFEVEIREPNATLGFVMLYIPDVGEALRFARKDDETYSLTYDVPGFAPPGVYSIHLYATGDNGTRTPSQIYKIRVV